MALFSGLRSMFGGGKTVYIILGLLLVAGIYMYSSRKGATILDGMMSSVPSPTFPAAASSGTSVTDGATEIATGAAVPSTITASAAVPESSSTIVGSKAPATVPSELLPKDIYSEWSVSSPGTDLNVTLDPFSRLATVSTPPTRNISLDLRGDVPIEKQSVGPWNQSTLEDVSSKSLNIGGFATPLA